jgi:hypothetical protein
MTTGCDLLIIAPEVPLIHRVIGIAASGNLKFPEM